jgi:hypothetical protein
MRCAVSLPPEQAELSVSSAVTDVTSFVEFCLKNMGTFIIRPVIFEHLRALVPQNKVYTGTKTLLTWHHRKLVT